MSDVAIRVEGLGKQYRIGAGSQSHFRYKSLRDSLAGAVSAPLRRLRRTGRPDEARDGDAENTIWALKDVSFEVKPGEVIGIIGRNGAGKSTLLKILSRITEPTEGWAEIHGRVGSLLEVGTGFHPELTGRENVYLNGAILGMRKVEIARKFDEIVAFAEVERFVDTPVKHYSSGMYVRLAFAVAAHLEPEILLVDEVLAVGDIQFQKKCLGKMGDVARGGRTILFVSHNMQAIQALCSTVLQVAGGGIVGIGEPHTIVGQYLSAISTMKSYATWAMDSAPGNDELRLTALRVRDLDGADAGVFRSCRGLRVEMEFIALQPRSEPCVGFDLLTSDGAVLFRSYQTDQETGSWPTTRPGLNRWYCTIPGGLMNAGVYHVSPRIGVHNKYWIVNLDAAVRFEVVLDHGVSPLWNSLDARARPGAIAPILVWQVDYPQLEVRER